jgi:hypothetical protein
MARDCDGDKRCDVSRTSVWGVLLDGGFSFWHFTEISQGHPT